MSSLFRSLNNSFSNKRENAVKQALINTLKENARDVEYELKLSRSDTMELCESTSSLCTTLEAIFLHGLKDSFLWQTISIIADDVERRPDPSFWSPIMVFMHKQVIEQIQSLSQVTSEIGLCRAWIRQSLNDSVFSAYLNNMRKNSSSLNPYYKKFALLKDTDCIETTAKILESLESRVQFNLPVNTSLLNYWPDYSLQLSGLWTPALKSSPISSGVDIAGSISTDTVAIPTPQPLRTNELFSESISNSPFSRNSNFGITDLNQRENLDMFLLKVDEMDIIDEEDTTAATKNDAETERSKILGENQAGTSSRICKENSTTQIVEAVSDETSNARHGNSLTNLMQTSWSSDLNAASDGASNDRFLQRSVSMTSSTCSLRSPQTDRCSYNALLRKHESNRGNGWAETWEKFLNQNSTSALSLNEDGNKDSQDETEHDDILERCSNDSHTNSEFEVISNAVLEKFDINELQELVEQLCKLAREPGLDAQGFLCKSCQHPLGIGYSNFQVCAFSGNYFCDGCMDSEPVLIPARIIYNWDFRKFNVSKRGATFLAEFRTQPLIDLKLLNPAIYHASDAMAELQSLRIRLNFIRAYLYTCSPSSLDELQLHFFGRKYLYDHIHQYSIADLALIHRGTLCQQLQKAFKVGEAHILKCHLCSVKGFICEICNSARVLYPFHIDTTYRCETCGSVFHANCLNEQQPCPRCERRRKREDLRTP